MTDNKLELSRRKILGAAGAVGIAGAGAGLGTSALFSDEESFTNNTITAGTLDLIVDWETEYDGPGAVQTSSGTLNGDPAVLVDLGDVKPGDTGRWKFCFRVVDNPAYLWMGGELSENDENGQTEPEEDVDITDGSLGTDKGELGDTIQATLSYEGGPDITSGSLKSVLEELQFGVPLDGDPSTSQRDCYPTSGGSCVVVDWEVPASVGNKIQSDKIKFGLQFFAQQCRNNDGTTNPTFDTLVSSGDSIQTAIDNAGAGDTIGIKPDSFSEQVVVDKPVTLAGAGQGSTVIQATSSLNSRFSFNGTDGHPVVSLESADAELWNLTVDGDRKGDNYPDFFGVGAYNAGVRLGNVEVKKVTDDPFSGNQKGVGIVALNDDSSARSTVIDGCNVHDYQKTGIVGEGDGLTLCVLDSTTTGAGSTTTNGQNGIQISDVSQGVIVGNTVEANYYTGSAGAAGIIAFNSGDVLIGRNIIKNNNIGIGVSGAGDITARRNNIDQNDFGAGNFGSDSFDARKNWWGASDGPSGEADPVTGSPADGSGDTVLSTGSADSIRWDPFANSAFSL
jgi:predicted ribosomally synthesized peptide with SipW-like signal peptide